MDSFRGQPGFRSYELIDAGAGLISVSRWEAAEQAHAAAEAAAASVAGNIEHPVNLSNTGEIALSSMVAASRPR